MVFLRIALLGFWAFYSFSMGMTPASGLNGFGYFVSLSFFIAAPALYLLPTYEAWKRDHRDLTVIALVNIFLGWSLIGWIVALVWALKQTQQVSIIPATEIPEMTPKTAGRETKSCAFCAEEILAAAMKCKHCGSQV